MLEMALALPDGDPLRAEALELISPRLAAHAERPSLAERVMDLPAWGRGKHRAS